MVGGAGVDVAVLSRKYHLGDLILDLSNPALSQALGDSTTIVNVERVLFYSGSGDSLTGGAFHDRIYGAISHNSLRGEGGDDTLNGGAGDDHISSLEYSAGDIINGGAGIDQALIYRNEALFAGGVSVSVADPTVKQTLADGTTFVNIERLYFKGGADGFYFNTFGGPKDTITDFASADTIKISTSVFGGGLQSGTDLAAAGRFVASATPVAMSNKGTFLYDTDSGVLSFDADGTGAGAAVARFLGSPALTAGDFDIV